MENTKLSEALEAIRKCESSNYLNTWHPRLVKDLKTIKQALIKTQEQDKIIKEKKVDTRILRNCLKDETPEDYNFLNNKHQLTQEEFDILKRWLG